MILMKIDFCILMFSMYMYASYSNGYYIAMIIPTYDFYCAYYTMLIYFLTQIDFILSFMF